MTEARDRLLARERGELNPLVDSDTLLKQLATLRSGAEVRLEIERKADYARPPARRVGRPALADTTTWTVTDDWLEEVPITEAEIDVFEAWFGDLFDKPFSTRH